MSGERGNGTSAEGAGATDSTSSDVVKGVGDAMATGATVTFFGGQSMFVDRLGVRDEVSNLCPARVSAGTQTNTRTLNRTATCATKLERPERAGCIQTNNLLYWGPPTRIKADEIDRHHTERALSAIRAE